MRQWMVDPRIMCRKHLLGEHVEHHMFIGAINKGISVAGYLRDNLLEPESLYTRHAELVKEMESRGYNHKSPLPDHIPLAPDASIVKINKYASLVDLLIRCPECRSRFESIYEVRGK